MKKVLSEKNFAALLFVMVLIAFAFAHEDTKKRDVFYNASAKSLPSIISSASTSLASVINEVKVEKMIR